MGMAARKRASRGQHGKREMQVIKVGEGRYGRCRDHGHSDLRRDGKGGRGRGDKREPAPPLPDNTLSQGYLLSMTGFVCAGHCCLAAHAAPGLLRSNRAASDGLFVITDERICKFC